MATWNNTSSCPPNPVNSSKWVSAGWNLFSSDLAGLEQTATA